MDAQIPADVLWSWYTDPYAKAAVLASAIKTAKEQSC